MTLRFEVGATAADRRPALTSGAESCAAVSLYATTCGCDRVLRDDRLPARGGEKGVIRLTPRFAELAAMTNFSFLRGASHPGGDGRARGRAWACRDRDRGPQHAGGRRARACVRAREQRRRWEGRASFPARGSPLTTERPTSSPIRRDRAAYGRLCRILTAGNLRAPKGECRLQTGGSAGAWRGAADRGASA